MKLRFFSNQRPKGPGNNIRIDDAANAMYNNGTAQRTDSWIIADTPAAVDMSNRDIAIIIAIEIGPEISQNNRQPYSALLFRNSLILRKILH